MGGFADRYSGRDPAKRRHMEGQRKLLARSKVAPQAFERDANIGHIKIHGFMGEQSDRRKPHRLTARFDQDQPDCGCDRRRHPDDVQVVRTVVDDFHMQSGGLARRRLARPRVNELQPSDLVGLVSNRWCQRS